jgi:hypothetical protein
MNAIEQILLKIKDHLEGIEIMVSDDRKLLTKLIYQVDHINIILRELIEVDEDTDDDFLNMLLVMTKEMNALKKLDQELKKHRKKISPGIMGES